MNRRLNLYKDKLPKRKRRASDDDVYIKGMYNPFLNTTGYDVEVIQEEGKTTAEKGVLADYPDFEGIGWIFDSEVKDVRHEPRGLRDASPEARVLRDYETLLKDRRNKMTQTFRYMLKQNSISSSRTPREASAEASSEPSPPSSMPSGLPNNISGSTSKSSDTPQQKSQMMEDANAREALLSDLRRLKEFFGFGREVSKDSKESIEEESEEVEEVSKKNSTPQPSSSSSSSRRSSNPRLPIYPSVTPPESVNSSKPQSINSSMPQSVSSSRRSSNSARPSTMLSSSGSVASTIDYGFNQ